MQNPNRDNNQNDSRLALAECGILEAGAHEKTHHLKQRRQIRSAAAFKLPAKLVLAESTCHALLQELPLPLEHFLRSSARCLRTSLARLCHLAKSVGPLGSSGSHPSPLIGLLSNKTSEMSASDDGFETEVSKSCCGFLLLRCVALHRNKGALVWLWETAPQGEPRS